MVGGAPAPALIPSSPALAVTAKAAPAKKRRSRKRVGDALDAWMAANPGWHHEDELLEVVIANKMTDADPKRALKIALGKQAESIFEGDGHGHWKLRRDTGAGNPPPPRSRARRTRSRRSRSTVSEPSPAARGRRRARLKTTRKSRSTSTGEEAPSDIDEGSEEGDVALTAEEEKGRKVLVKRGQSRKSASMPPGELEARQEAATNIDRRRQKRWDQAQNRDMLERARKNLLGLGKN